MKEALLAAGLIIANPNGAVDQFPEALCTPNERFCITGVTACSIPNEKQSALCFVVQDNGAKISKLVPLSKLSDFDQSLIDALKKMQSK